MTTINLTEATIAKLDLKPDDVVVLRVTDPNYMLTAKMADEMRTRVRAALGDHEVIVLAHGLDLEIVQRPVDDAAFGEADGFA